MKKIFVEAARDSAGTVSGSRFSKFHGHLYIRLVRTVFFFQRSSLEFHVSSGKRT